MKKYLLIFFGSVSLALGAIGVFIPVLPTTPFLLLSALCYFRSSEKLYQWLIHHKIFGRTVYCYITYKAIPRRTKIGTLISLWCTLLISMLLVSHLHIRIFLFAVGAGVSIHLLTLRTLSDGEVPGCGTPPCEELDIK